MNNIQTIKITDPAELEKCKLAKEKLDNLMDKLRVLEMNFTEERNAIAHDLQRTIKDLWMNVAPSHFSEYKKLWTVGSCSFVLEYIDEHGDAYIRRDRTKEKGEDTDEESGRPLFERLH